MGELSNLLDESVLEQLKELEGETKATLLEELCNLYLATAPVSFQLIVDAVGSGNSAQVESESHKLKSSSGNLGATKLQARCESFERFASSKNLKQAKKDLDAFKAEFNEVIAELRTLLTKL